MSDSEEFQDKSLINKTPHPLNIYVNGEEYISIDTQGEPTRVSVDNEKIDSIGTIPIVETEYGEVENLPDIKEGQLIAVSRMVAKALPERNDLVIPTDLVRDDEGNIIGAESLEVIK